jgi:salicylate hydroxylase
MAIEDGSVLGNLFSHLTDASQIPYFLRAYETLRLSRTANTQAQSRLNQKIFHYEDGPEQEARDASMRAAMRGQTEGSANQWADKAKSKIQFSYDADAAAEEWWREVGSKERALAGAK